VQFGGLPGEEVQKLITWQDVTEPEREQLGVTFGKVVFVTKLNVAVFSSFSPCTRIPDLGVRYAPGRGVELFT
jgi:hypothetical protein